MLRIRRLALVCLVPVLLAGCTSFHDELIARGYPPAYADGYSDGCQTGKQAVNGIGYMHKDAARFATEKVYQEGWNTGYERCVNLAQSEEQDRYAQQLKDNEERARLR